MLLPGVELLPGSDPDPDRVAPVEEGERDKYVPRSSKATLILLSRSNTAPMTTPRLVRFVVRGGGRHDSRGARNSPDGRGRRQVMKCRLRCRRRGPRHGVRPLGGDVETGQDFEFFAALLEGGFARKTATKRISRKLPYLCRTPGWHPRTRHAGQTARERAKMLALKCRLPALTSSGFDLRVLTRSVA